jgi:hypothetical protein
MNSQDWQRLKDMLNKAYLEAQALQLEASHRQLPADPEDRLNQCERDTLTLPDELPQKQDILRDIALAREAMAKSDFPEVKLRFLRIFKNRENARHDLWAGKADSCYMAQVERAQKSRNPTLKGMVAELAKRPRWTWKPRDLWPELISMLDRAEMDPKETGNRHQPDTWRITYTDDKGNPKPLSYRRFENMVSEARKK